MYRVGMGEETKKRNFMQDKLAPRRMKTPSKSEAFSGRIGLHGKDRVFLKLRARERN